MTKNHICPESNNSCQIIKNLKEIIKQQTTELNELKKQLSIELTKKKIYQSTFDNNAANYRLILDNIQDGFFECNLSGRLTFINKVMWEISGYSEEELLGLHYRDYTSGKTTTALFNVFSKIFKTGKTDNILDYEMIKKDGQKRVLAISVSLIRDNSGKATGFRGIARDITARREAEQALEQAHEKLEQRVKERTTELLKTNTELLKAKELADASAKTKTEFLANMSHEIRTPLNAIIGMSELLLTTNQINKQKEYLDVIRNSSKSLLDLINDILDYSKIDAKQLDIEIINFNIHNLIDEVADMFLERNMSKHLELIIDIRSKVPEELSGDPLRLKQVLVNLLSNAFKFTEKGEICISVALLSKEDNFVELIFCVKDTGIGIDSVLCERTNNALFDAFAQADGSTTRKYGGTGLGLAICKKIVELMQGTIWVESKLGQGSAFYFTCKLIQVKKYHPKKTTLPRYMINKKVLIVDDNPSTLMVLKRYMEAFGFKSKIVDSADKALKIYQQALSMEPFSLILMDIKLPGSDGITIAEKIKQNKTPNTPAIIMISAIGHDKEILRAKKAGVESFLMKPIKQSLLFDTIMQIFGNNTLRYNGPIKFTSSEKLSASSILVVEDNVINQMVVIEMLKIPNICIGIANNGVEALEHLRKKSYDLILMDIQMPEMDGIETTKAIRYNLNLKNIPIIAMTAHAMYGDREKCIAAGMNDYLSKPLDRQLLVATIHKYTQQVAEDSNIIETQFGPHCNLPMIHDLIPGLNIREGLTRLGGSWDKYLKILKSFSTSFENFSEKATKMLEEKNYAGISIDIHALKGTSGNISANELYLSAKSFEKAVLEKNIEQMQISLAPVSESLNIVIQSINKLTRNNSYSKKINSLNTRRTNSIFDFSKILVICPRLYNSLKSFDPVESENYLNKIKSYLSYENTDQQILKIFNDMTTRAEDYDFESAIQFLEIFQRKLSGK